MTTARENKLLRFEEIIRLSEHLKGPLKEPRPLLDLVLHRIANMDPYKNGVVHLVDRHIFGPLSDLALLPSKGYAYFKIIITTPFLRREKKKRKKDFPKDFWFDIGCTHGGLRSAKVYLDFVTCEKNNNRLRIRATMSFMPDAEKTAKILEYVFNQSPFASLLDPVAIGARAKAPRLSHWVRIETCFTYGLKDKIRGVVPGICYSAKVEAATLEDHFKQKPHIIVEQEEKNHSKIEKEYAEMAEAARECYLRMTTGTMADKHAKKLERWTRPKPNIPPFESVIEAAQHRLVRAKN